MDEMNALRGRMYAQENREATAIQAKNAGNPSKIMQSVRAKNTNGCYWTHGCGLFSKNGENYLNSLQIIKIIIIKKYGK